MLKPTRIENPKLLAEVRKQKCVVTKRTPSDPHHVCSVKSGGPDTEWNLMPLARVAHMRVHRMGMLYMKAHYLCVDAWLTAHGWYLDDLGKLRHTGLEVENA